MLKETHLLCINYVNFKSLTLLGTEHIGMVYIPLEFMGVQYSNWIKDASPPHTRARAAAELCRAELGFREYLGLELGNPYLLLQISLLEVLIPRIIILLHCELIHRVV